MQRSFIEGVFGEKIDYSRLRDFGVDVNGGYIPVNQEGAFVDFIQSNPKLETHLVVKMHTSFSERLEAEFLRNDNIFISLSVRDPVEIFESARRNFRRTGEFSEFSNIDSGLLVLNVWYKQILENTIRISFRKTIPIVSYENIMQDPAGAALKSLSSVFGCSSELDPDKYINFNDVGRLSAHRKSAGEEIFDQSGRWCAEKIIMATSDFREKLKPYI